MAEQELPSPQTAETFAVAVFKEKIRPVNIRKWRMDAPSPRTRARHDFVQQTVAKVRCSARGYLIGRVSMPLRSGLKRLLGSPATARIGWSIRVIRDLDDC